MDPGARATKAGQEPAIISGMRSHDKLKFFFQRVVSKEQELRSNPANICGSSSGGFSFVARHETVIKKRRNMHTIKA